MSRPCHDPIAPAALADYWLEAEGGPDDLATEEHLLGCDSCSGRLRGLVALGEGVSHLARRGVVEMVVTPSFLAKAEEEGLRTREYRVGPGGRVDCTVTPEDDLLVSRLEGDFRGIARLDVVTQEEGQPEHRVEDVPVGPESAELIVAQAMPVIRTRGRFRLRIRLLAPGTAGDRLVGEYTFDHTPGGR